MNDRDALGLPLFNEIVNGAQPIDQFVFRDDYGHHFPTQNLLSDAECSLAHAECDKEILKRVDYQAFSVKYRGTNFELGNGMGPKK